MLGFDTLLLALAAAWSANLIARDGSCSRLLAVIGVTAVGTVAVGGAIALFVAANPGATMVLVGFLGRRIRIFRIGESRYSEARLWLDTRISLALVMFGLLTVTAV